MEPTSLNSDWIELLRGLNAAGVKYLIIGAHAVAYHARPRATKDFDILFDPTPANARKVLAALNAFLGADLGYTVNDLCDHIRGRFANWQATCF